MQNPAIYVSGTSGLESLLQHTRRQWDQMKEFQAMPEPQSEQRKLQVLRHILQGFYSDVERPVIIDKSRGWDRSDSVYRNGARARSAHYCHGA